MIKLFGRYSGNLRFINTCKNRKGEKCIAKHGETIFAIQQQRSFIGITYWKTIFESTDYNQTVEYYKTFLVGHPDFWVNI